MTKKLKLKLTRAFASVLLLCVPDWVGFQAQATRFVTENFEYNVGQLYGQGSWLQYGSQDAVTLDVVEKPLMFNGYQGTAIGNAAQIGNVASGQDAMIKFAETPVEKGAIYVSALINVQMVTADNVYFLSFLAPGTGGVVDKRTSSEIGRLFATAGSEGKFKLKLARNNSSQFAESEAEYDLNTTYLVVVMYQFVDGAKNDILKLWVNPLDMKNEPAANATIEDVTAFTSADASRIQAVELRQGSTSSFTGPEVTIDALRIADSWADLFDQVNPGEPELNVVPSVVYSLDAAAIGSETIYATYTVNYKNLPSSTQVYLTGINSDQFAADVTEIPAGEGTAEVTLTYKPTKIGKHTARINFESTVNTLNCGFGAEAMAYDPNNLPSITVNADNLTEFKCKVGETVEQSFKVVTANFPDYGKAVVKGDAGGAFTINNATLLKSGETLIKVTFKPLKTGNFTETITLSGVKAESKTVTLAGVALQGGGTTPGAEGDELPLGELNPYKLLVEHFDGATKNTPLAVTDWKNLALQGTRAWWGYEWAEDGNKAAKVTPYDMKIETGAGTPCVMMLVTPPLDYKNAASQTFSFRVMGDFMINGMADKLEVCYMEKDGDSFFAEPIDIPIPATKDLNKEWQSFDVHLENQNIADVFYMGFRFTSTRGSDNTATYYIDDVTWGVEVTTGVTQVTTAKTISSVKYANLAGQVSDKPFDGVNIVRTTYSDGTVSTQKVMK